MAVLPDFEQVGNLFQREAQPLRRLDDTEHRDRFGAVEPMASGCSFWLLERPSTLVVAKGFLVRPGSRHLASTKR
jgi:hypothetical protein